MRQPHDMGGVNVKGLETTRTNERQVSPAKQGQVVEILRLNIPYSRSPQRLQQPARCAKPPGELDHGAGSRATP